MNEENKNLNAIASEKPENAALNSDNKKTEKAAKVKKSKKNNGFKSFMKSRKAKHGSIAVVIVAVVIVITIVINIVCGLLVDRFPNLKFDLTANKAFELQSDTVEYMQKLEDDVEINILSTKSSFENNGTYFIQAENLLEKMEKEANGRINISYVDISTNPNFTSKYPDINWDGSIKNIILVESGSQYRALTLEDCFEYDSSYYSYSGSYQFTGTKIEQAIVTAILNVTTKDKVVVDMITGNGEQDYSAIKSLLEKNAYQVNEVSLATSGIDDNADIIFLFAPSVDLDQGATEKLSTWLSNNKKYGKTMIYIPNLEKVDTPNLDGLLSEWGMQIDEGYVFETNPQYLVSNSSPYAFITDYTDYYRDNLKNAKIPVLTSNAHNVIIKDKSAAHALLTTSTNAGVCPYEPDDDWNYQDAIKGSALNIAAEGVKTGDDDAKSNMIVFGSYMMFTENVMSINSFNNSAYLMNIVNTVADKADSAITIESKSLDSGELGITDITPGNVILVIFVFIVPIGILITGIIVWLRRRNR